MRWGILILTLLLISSAFALSEDQIKSLTTEELEGLSPDDMIQLCKENPLACDCSQLKKQAQAGDEQIRECNEKLKEGLEKMQKQKRELMEKCQQNLDLCDCSKIEKRSWREECEKARSAAYAERERITEECSENLDKCDCSKVTTSGGRTECEQMKQQGLEKRDEMKEKCTKDPLNCDCNILPAHMKKGCEKEKEKMFKQAEKDIVRIINECANDVENCDCTKIVSPDYQTFCETQKQYALDCMNIGANCDKLSEINILPANVPEFLKVFLKQSVKDVVKRKLNDASTQAQGIIQECIETPEKCKCDTLKPAYKEFCQQKKELQLKCYANDYTACMELENQPDLPENFNLPGKGIIQALINTLKNAKKQIVLATASKDVGMAIMNCITSPNTCDCSVAPQGEFRTFCERKKELNIKCQIETDIDSCFILDEEELMPESTPEIIKGFIKGIIEPQVNALKDQVFNRMKPEECNTLTKQQCKEAYKKMPRECKGLGVKECTSLMMKQQQPCKGITEYECMQKLIEKIPECSNIISPECQEKLKQPIAMSGQIIQAEDETRYNVKTPGTAWDSKEMPYTGSDGKVWYLSRQGDYVIYNISLQSGTYYLWINDHRDKHHIWGVRAVNVYINDELKTTFKEHEGLGWKWHLVGQLEITAGNNEIKLEKQETTSAAAIIDKLYITSSSNDSPLDIK